MDWKPQPKQIKALVSTCFETLFGGAKGGGKSAAGRAWLLYDIDHPEYRALVIRQNQTDLRDWVDKARIMYKPTGAIFKGNPVEIHFPKGGIIYTGHLKDSNSYTKYQGNEFHRILLEELTHIPTEVLYLQLISSCRSVIPELPARVFATTNPGSVGHSWVKKRFIDPVRPFEVFTDPVSGRTRTYIPATVDDNSFLAQNDPQYVSFLDSLPEDLRQQYRYGNWELTKIKGAYYAEDINQAQQESRVCKVPIMPYEPVYTAWDLGINDTQVCWFFQFNGLEIRFIDCYSDNGKGFAFYLQMLREKNYKYGIMNLPHDGTKRSAETLRSFQDILVGAGYQVNIIPRTNNKVRDIELSRAMFPRCWFDSEKCADGLNALTNYRQQFNETRGVFSDSPYHDWTSNFADAFQVVAHSIPQTNVALPSRGIEYLNSDSGGLQFNQYGEPI